MKHFNLLFLICLLFCRQKHHELVFMFLTCMTYTFVFFILLGQKYSGNCFRHKITGRVKIIRNCHR